MNEIKIKDFTVEARLVNGVSFAFIDYGVYKMVNGEKTLIHFFHSCGISKTSETWKEELKNQYNNCFNLGKYEMSKQWTYDDLYVKEREPKIYDNINTMIDIIEDELNTRWEEIRHVFTKVNS